MRAVSLLLLSMLASQPHSYGDAHAESLRTGRVLVVGVGCAPPASKEWLTVIVRTLDGYKSPSIVVGVPDGKAVRWRATLPPGATADDIRNVLTIRERAGQPRVQPQMQQYQPSRVSPVAPVRGGNPVGFPKKYQPQSSVRAVSAIRC